MLMQAAVYSEPSLALLMRAVLLPPRRDWYASTSADGLRGVLLFGSGHTRAGNAASAFGLAEREKAKMAQTKGGNGEVKDDDLLSAIDDDEPEPRKSGPRDSEPFVPNPRLMEAIAQRFADGKAVAVRKDNPYPTANEARHNALVYLRHALEVAGQMDPPKSARIVLVNVSGETSTVTKEGKEVTTENGPFYAKVQLTHKRIAKKDDDAKDDDAKDDAKETAKTK